MSITGLSEPDKLYKKSFHHNYRNDSGEIDVFEAARYFSGYNEVSGYNCGSYNTQKIMREERRMSLDVPVRDLLPQHRIMEKPKPKEKIKHKQPSSPGGRLASFLNSLFNQAALKKKKSSKSSTQSMKDEEESPGGRRRRRSSISHFRSSSTTDSRSSVYPSSTSGFRTPPPYTPTKGYYKDFGNYSDQKEVVSISKYSNIGHQAKSTIVLQNGALDAKRNADLSWLDEKLKLHNGLSEKCKISSTGTTNIRSYLEKDRIFGEKHHHQSKEIKKQENTKKFDDDEFDDGADSDSSSDLFELQNYDLGFYPSGLPVYETTHLDSIKRGTQISNGPQ